ncbi:MAG: glutamate 5-kinase [Firmicutes bacterium]|nr:glutamate 5-kinase [Bacillota bacterium]
MDYKKNKDIHRMVIKIGTSSLTHSTGNLNYRHIEKMAAVICDLKNMGYEVVLVSSGALGVGLGKTNLTQKPAQTAGKRALAAIGQSSLMAIYDEVFNVYGCKVSQVLLTKSDVKDDHSRNNIADAFFMLFRYGAIPVVNENDVVVSDDSFGDNDTLAAYVAQIIGADLLIIWSDIDGLYNKNPREYPDAKLIPVVKGVTEDLYKMAGGAGSARGCGGMLTKLNAAAIANQAGIDMVIANSFRPDDIYELLCGKSVGTRFKAQKNKA